MVTEAQATKACDKVRALCLDLPEVSERMSHGSPTWFIRDKKTFCTFVNDHHGDGILGVWCAAPAGAQEAMIAADPERYFRPPYVGHRGWVGVRLHGKPNWDEFATVIEDAYCAIAPAKLVALVR
jgi:hypothetical protein